MFDLDVVVHSKLAPHDAGTRGEFTLYECFTRSSHAVKSTSFYQLPSENNCIPSPTHLSLVLISVPCRSIGTGLHLGGPSRRSSQGRVSRTRPNFSHFSKDIPWTVGTRKT